ncbi:hypothetical protein [Archangium sp.]|uniref:hypothetical protein n=1 Tax=Archangium sp. TaxID=1872627 RepID=UPI002D28C7C3|nr:hypothetical protein [Archangium sp.]HYO51238.1 hypothetical protein [Archangium sp.]
MLKKSLFGTIQLFVIAAAAACGEGAAPGDEAHVDSTSTGLQTERHCLVRMEPGDTAGAPAKLSPMTCYRSISEVISAATHGRVVLPATTKASELNEMMLRAAGYDDDTAAVTASYLVGTDYADSNFGGESYTWTASVPCYDRFTGASYTLYAPSMPDGWDNRISSVKTYQYCRSTTVYDYTNQGGISMVTGCESPSLSWMDNRASSRSWSRDSYGTYCWF